MPCLSSQLELCLPASIHALIVASISAQSKRSVGIVICCCSPTSGLVNGKFHYLTQLLAAAC